jgi:hypothetical protein
MPGKHSRDAIAELEAAKWTVIYSGPQAQAHAYAKARCPDGLLPAVLDLGDTTLG